MRNFPCSPTWIIVMFLIITNLTAIQAIEQPKIALLIAIGDYPAETGWQKISSKNDLALIQKALLAQGFDSNKISVLADHDATKDGIIAAIRQQILNKVKAGWVVYFHFSGHGQQVADDNGDELDGFDEAIVPINSPMSYQPGVNEGQNLIRDDELGKLFNEIRAKLGPQGSLLAVLDACHSGTGTRGFGIARGSATKMAPDDYKVANLSRGTDQSTLESLGGDDEHSLAPMVAFFGAAHNQLNFETTDDDGKSVGSLSFAFSKKFALATPNTTYRMLFEQIRLEMSAIAPRQQPQAEGSLDQEILGGSMVGSPSYFRVGSWIEPGLVTVNAGWLHGIYEGAVIGLYPLGTSSIAGKTPIAKGVVKRADATACTLYLESDLERDAALGAWAYVLERSFGNLQMSVKLALPAELPLTQVLERRFENLPVQLEENTPELIVTSTAGASRGAAVQLVTNSDIVLETFPDNLSSDMLAERIVQQLKAYGQAKFLKNMAISSYELPVELELVPVKYDLRSNSVLGEIPLAEKQDQAGVVHFQDGDVVKIKVTNHGSRPAYFTVLDIQPDNVVNVLIPDSHETPAEFYVPPGQTIEVKRLFKFAPPAGTEVFKLIATDKPIDLRPIASSRGTGTKSNSSSFERMFSQTFYTEETRTRGGRPISVGVSEVNVASFTFIID